eukprot:SAG11_NODE_2255_length_3620_cov_1.538483_7_plen_60_part_00
MYYFGDFICRVKKEALLFFIFTGVDAEMDTAEAEAMCEFNAQFVKVLANRWGKGAPRCR